MNNMMDQVWSRVKNKKPVHFNEHPKAKEFQDVFGLVVSMIMAETMNHIPESTFRKMITDRGISDKEFDELYQWIGGMELHVHLDILQEGSK